MNEKDAGIKDHVARRLRNVAERGTLARQADGRAGIVHGDPGGLLRFIAGRLATDNTVPIVSPAFRGAKKTLDVALRPGQSPIFQKTHDAIGSIPRVPLILALAGIPVTVLGMQRASADSSYLRKMTDAQAKGELPMSEHTFRSFTERRKHGAAMEKQAGRLGIVSDVAGKGVGVIDDLLKKLLYTTRDVDVTNLHNVMDPRDIDKALVAGKLKAGPGLNQLMMEESTFSAPRAIGVGAAALGLGLGADILGEPLVERAQAAMGYGVPDLQQEAATSFSREAGKQTAGMLGDLTRMVAGQAVNAIQDVPLSREQRRVFGHAVKMDPLLSGATDHEIAMMERSFKTMVRFAPQLATDEFAVRNYLRESLMSSSGGPDYGTIANLARTSQTIEGR